MSSLSNYSTQVSTTLSVSSVSLRGCYYVRAY